MPALGLTAGIAGQAPGVGVLRTGQDLIYLLRDLFTTADGPGTRTRAADGVGKLSIVDGSNNVVVAGGVLAISGSAAALRGATGINLFSRQIGRAFLVRVQNRGAIGTGSVFGLGRFPTDQAVDIGCSYSSTTAVNIRDGLTNIDAYTLGSGNHHLGFIERGAGGYLVARNGDTGKYKLLWVYNTSTNTTNEYPKIKVNGSTQQFNSGDFRMINLAGPFTTEYGPATSRVLAPAAASTTPSTADALIEWTFTYTSGGNRGMVQTRYTNGSNCWRFYANATGFMSLTEINNGAFTARGTSTGACFTNGVASRVLLRQEGNVYTVYVDNVLQFTYTDPGSFNTTATTVQVSTADLTEIVCYPLNLDVIEPVSGANKYSLVLPVGDSKTLGTGDDNPPVGGFNGYPPILAASLTAALSGGRQWAMTARAATGGYDTPTMLANFQPFLDNAVETPDVILWNLGVNDLGNAVSQSTFESSYGQILDMAHAKWPSARQYLARVWSNGTKGLGNFTLLNDTWIPDVIATRPWASLGLDERTFLPGPSGIGTEYTIDGTHPNRAGYTLTAAAWKASMVY